VNSLTKANFLASVHLGNRDPVADEVNRDSKANLKKGFLVLDISGSPLMRHRTPGLFSVGGPVTRSCLSQFFVANAMKEKADRIAIGPHGIFRIISQIVCIAA
jgi:hypothetical protein